MSRDFLIKPQPIQNDVNNTFTVGGTDLKKFSGPNARAQLYSDRIEAMTIDNASL